MTVRELRDKLNEMIEAGHGDALVTYPTQDGAEDEDDQDTVYDVEYRPESGDVYERGYQPECVILE